MTAWPTEQMWKLEHRLQGVPTRRRQPPSRLVELRATLLRR